MDLKEIIKRLILDTVLNIVIQRIVAAVPFLGLPIIGPIFVLLATKFGSMIVSELATHADFIVIDGKTDAEVRKYNDAVKELSAALEGETDAKSIADAEKDFKDRMRELISMRPA